MANKGTRSDPGHRDSRNVTALYQSHRPGESATKASSRSFLLWVCGLSSQLLGHLPWLSAEITPILHHLQEVDQVTS